MVISHSERPSSRTVAVGILRIHGTDIARLELAAFVRVQCAWAQHGPFTSHEELVSAWDRLDCDEKAGWVPTEDVFDGFVRERLPRLLARSKKRYQGRVGLVAARALEMLFGV